MPSGTLPSGTLPSGTLSSGTLPWEALPSRTLRSKMRQVITNCSALCSPVPGKCKILQEIDPDGTLASVMTVAFIGAGSVEFTRNVVTDLCGYPEFRGDLHFALYDISTERLAHAERLARRISEQSGAGATVTATTDRRTALAGARYVINEVQVGGYAATRADFDIPARYGVRQTIGDTLGIGGIFRGLRTIPVTVALARDMAEVCPDAYLLSYSNPMAVLPWAVYEGSGFSRVYGLCHSVRDTQAFLAGLVGADPERVRFLTAGFNHQAFVLRFEQDGESLYPRLATVVEASPELRRRVPGAVFRRVGYFPARSGEPP